MRWPLSAAVALLLLSALQDANASSGGVTGYAGQNGQYCAACHLGPQNTARATVLITGTPPYVHTQTYPVEYRVCVTSAQVIRGGFDVQVTGLRGGGLLSVAAGQTNATAVNNTEVRHTSRLTSTAPTDASWFPGTCAQELRVRMNWQPPALPPTATAAERTVRFFGASNWGPTGVGRTVVITADVSQQPNACSTNQTANCGRPATVAASSCPDADDDGYVSKAACPETTGATAGGDCNDNDPEVHPIRVDVCNGADDDCDGQTDEDAQVMPFYQDSDGDGHGTAVMVGSFCEGQHPANSAPRSGDCNDGNPAINPSAAELCDGIDNNCADGADEVFTFTSRGQVRLIGDICDDPNDADLCELGRVSCTSTTTVGCTNDMLQMETCNGMDDDCDGDVDENWPIFQRGLRLTAGMPCDALTDADQCPNGVVTCVSIDSVQCLGDMPSPEFCDGMNVDNDCDGLVDKEDGYAALGNACTSGEGCGMGRFVCTTDGTGVMCDMTQQPQEICGNGIDDNCNNVTDELEGTWMGLQPGEACDRPDDGDQCSLGTVGCVAGNTIGCVETVDRVEVCHNQVDDDCDGLFDEECPDAGVPDAAMPSDAGPLEDAGGDLMDASTADASVADAAGGRDAALPADASTGDRPDGSRRRDAGRFDAAWPETPKKPDDSVCACAQLDAEAPLLGAILMLVAVRRRRR